MNTLASVNTGRGAARRKTASYGRTVPASRRKVRVCGGCAGPSGAGQPGSPLGQWTPIGAAPPSPSMNRYDGHLAVGRAGRGSPMSTAACFRVATTGSTVPWRTLLTDGAGFGGTIRAFAWASPTRRTGPSGVVRNDHPDTRVPQLGRAAPVRRLPPRTSRHHHRDEDAMPPMPMSPTVHRSHDRPQGRYGRSPQPWKDWPTSSPLRRLRRTAHRWPIPPLMMSSGSRP
jgi:hypothetical protein